MNCPTKNGAAELVLNYCARKLNPTLEAEFEAHIEQCADCSCLVNAQREVWQALESWDAVPVSADFDARLYARIQQEQSSPAWRLWLRRVFQPAVPYAFWKPAIPVAAACMLLAAGLYVRTADVPEAVPQLRADKVDIEQVEQTLEDLDLLTPVSQTPAGSM